MTVSSAAAQGRGRDSREAYQVRYASFEGRVAAGALDILVLFIIASLFVSAGSLVVLISSDFEKVDPSSTAINLFWVCIVSIIPAYFLYFFIGLAWKGQTVGAAVMQIMVIRSDGRPLGVLGAVARVIGLLFYVLVVLIGVAIAYSLRNSTAGAAAAIAGAFFVATLGFLWAAFDRHRRTLHDRLAGTIVVRIG
jgi:uncharacterized RDD family membrane protein YckC